jgi:hypothetical protein
MRQLREQPRRVVAKLAVAFLVLVAAAALGSALASSGPEGPTDLRPPLERSQRLIRQQSNQLEALTAQAARLRSDLQRATRRARARARANERLRRERDEAQRSLARARNQ